MLASTALARARAALSMINLGVACGRKGVGTGGRSGVTECLVIITGGGTGAGEKAVYKQACGGGGGVRERQAPACI